MMGSLNRLSHPNTEDEAVSVTSVTLDHFLEGIQEQSLAIWIDVEGAVDRVLAGAQSTMPKVQALICEVEDARVWQGQTMDTEIVSRFRYWQLVPVLCDCQKKFQYNLIMLKSCLLRNPDIQDQIKAFPAKASDLLRATVGG
jgi:hypothetical protein